MWYLAGPAHDELLDSWVEIPPLNGVGSIVLNRCGSPATRTSMITQFDGIGSPAAGSSTEDMVRQIGVI